MKKILILLLLLILCLNLIACQDFSFGMTDNNDENTDTATDTNNEKTDTATDTNNEKTDNNDENTDISTDTKDETIDTTLEDNDEEAVASKAILGTWLATGIDGYVTFKENGIGEFTGFDETSFNWEYNKDHKYYSLSIPYGDDIIHTNITINRAKSSSVDYVTIKGCRFFSMNSGIKEGSRIFEVQSNSMEPFFKSGDIILCDPVEDAKDLRVGDIISFQFYIGDYMAILNHRIVNIYEYEGNLFFETQGDNTPAPDRDPRSENDIMGKFTKILYSK